MKTKNEIFNTGNINININVVRVGYVIYIVFVLAFKLFRAGSGFRAINPLGSLYDWNPFASTRDILFHWKYMVANAVLLLPAGFLCKKHWRLSRYWIFGITVSIALEVLQPVFNTGVSDALSMLLLLAGYALGGLIFVQYHRRMTGINEY